MSSRVYLTRSVFNFGGYEMAASYKKLWKKLIDLDMKKRDLEEKAQVSHYTINKLNKGENITIDVLEKYVKH